MIDLRGSAESTLDHGSRLPFQSTSRVMVRFRVRRSTWRITTARGRSSQTTTSARAHTRSRTEE